MQPGYLPWLGFFELMSKVDLFVFLDDVQYTKRDWRNRNRIRTVSGWQWLTIPVLNKQKSTQLIKDVNLNNSMDWRKKHLKALRINYQKAEFFDAYFNDIERIFSQDWTSLSEITITLILFLKEKMGITTPCARASAFEIKSRKTERIVEICELLGAGHLYDSKAAAAFINTELFRDKGIKIEFQDYTHPVYKQVYEPFIPYLSAIDLLFNCGPDSLRIISGK